MVKYRRLVIIVSFAIALIGLASLWTLARITADVREEIGESLTAVLETTQQALNSWAHEHSSEAQLWADSQEVLRLTKELLDVEPTRETLIDAPIQEEMRSFILPLSSQRDHQGYCIIGPDNLSLSSARDDSIGVKNVLAYHGDVLERIWSGETVLSFLLPSDVPLMDENGILIEEAPTMFAGVPIRDNTGEVIALLTIHIDPSHELSAILKRGRLGGSGETYVFDENGRLISESRFDDQLREIGLIEPDEHAILNVEIRDPGVNLVEGEQSIIPREDQPLTRMAESAVAGESGIDLEGYRDYRGVPVIGAWLWDEELDLGITIEVDVSDAYATLSTIRLSVIALTVFIMLLMIGMATIFGIARERLKENEERYRGIFAGVRDAILVESMTGEILDANTRACELYGWSRDELLTKTGLDLVAEGYKAIVSGNLEGAELPPKPVETFNVRANGEHFPVEVSARFHAIGDENVMLVVVRDITERKRSDEALKESEAQYRDLVERAGIGIVIDDVEGNFAYFNDHYAEMYGYSPEEMREQTIESTTHPDDIERVHGFHHGRIKGEEVPSRYEVRGIRKDGSVLHVELDAVLLEKDGITIGTRTYVWDIAERVLARELLQQSEAAYHGIFDGVQDAIIVESMTGKVMDVNTRACELYGWSRDELLTKTGLDLVAEGHSAIVSGNMEGAELSPKPVETFNVRANGEHFPVEISARYHTIGDEKVMLVVVRDITERKQAEQQLKSYAAKIEQANEEVKQFAYIVSHDMRAPLVNLKGFATELRAALAVIGAATISILPQLDAGLRKNVETALGEDVPEALGFIDTAVTRMDHFINALLKLSRLGHRELQFEPVDTKAIVQATLETLAHTIEERQVEVIVGSLPEVIADMTSMEQIMANIISNAMKYLNPDRPGKIEITAERGDDEVTFMIHDNGRGIAKEDKPKVFAPFRRIGVQEVPGEGMGLPYVQALVRRHGGRIWCESELGVGTTFSFTISNRLEKGVEDAETA
jgi:PAS domain S-box-containing protein